MTSHRTPVVAVFGGSEGSVLEPAERLGRAIVARGAVLVTGGRGPKGSGADAARGRAVMGATPGRRSSWVEVERNGEPAPAEMTDFHVVLHVGFGHRRNFVEAHLCDVAIVLPGEEGTASELAFCLALGRPALLLGDGWADVRRRHLDDRAVTSAALVKAVDERVRRKDAGSPWDDDIEAARDRLMRREWSLADVVCGNLPPDDDVAAAHVDIALRLVDLDALPGAFPPRAMSSPLHAEMAQAYAEWLARRPPLGS